MLVDSPLLSINKSILVAKTPISLPLQLPVSLLKRNPKIGLTVTYSDIEELGVELIFNKNIIKLKDKMEYIKETVNAVIILYIKQGHNCKDNIPTYLKVSLN